MSGIGQSALALRFKSLFGFETKSLATPDASLLELFGAMPASSGVVVTPRSAMTCTPVRAAVQAISEAIGQLPLIAYKRGPDGSKERAPDHPVYPLVHDQANDWTPAGNFREAVTRDALLQPQGGFAFINRVEGRPVELLRLEPETVTVAADQQTGEPVYRVGKGAGAKVIDRRNILHIPSPSFSGLIHDGREAIALALVMERHAGTLFGNGARPSGILKFAGKLGDEAAKRIKSAWQAAHGAGKSGNTAVLEEGASWEALALSSVDAQFLEMRKFAIEEIARLFRVPPIFLMEYGRATWGNSAEMRQQFLTFALLPWIGRWQGEIRLKLFSEDERDTYFAEFLTDDFLRADLTERADSYAKLIAARVLNPNEVRAAENRPPYAGGEKFENPNTVVGGANV